MGDKRTFGWTIAVNIAFTLGVLTLIIILSSLAYEREKLGQIEYWLGIIVNGVALIYLFANYRYTNIKVIKSKDKGFQKANIMHSKMCDTVKANNLRDKVEHKIAVTNSKNLREAQENLLERVTSIFTVEEVITLSNDELRSQCHEKGFSTKHTRKVIKVANKIRNGKVRYVKYTLHEVLNNPTSTSVNKQISAKTEKWIALGEFASKFFSYVIITAIFGVLMWTGNFGDLLKEIFLRGTLVFSAIQSGLKSATFYVGRCKDRLVNKNDVLAEVEGISYDKIENEANNILAIIEQSKT